MKRFWITHYFIGRTRERYRGVIQAESQAEAEELIKQRGLGEEFQYEGSSNLRLMAMIEDERWTEALHEACYLSFLCLKAGVATVEEVLGDNGLVHDIAHLLTIYTAKTLDKSDRYNCKRRVKRIAKRLEAKLPGHPSTEREWNKPTNP